MSILYGVLPISSIPFKRSNTKKNSMSANSLLQGDKASAHTLLLERGFFAKKNSVTMPQFVLSSVCFRVSKATTEIEFKKSFVDWKKKTKVNENFINNMITPLRGLSAEKHFSYEFDCIYSSTR